MLRSLFRLLADRTRPRSVKSRPTIVLYAQVDQEFDQNDEIADHVGPRIQKLPAKTAFARPQPGANHRARLLSMRLEYTQLCSPHRCERLAELGIVTAGDLATASPERLAKQFKAWRKAQRVLKQYRRAIRFAASVPGMMPRDALLLINIHRRSPRGLSLESAAGLRRDLDRFAQSSQGRAHLRGRRLPSTRRLKQWINACRETTTRQPAHARVA